MPAILKCRRDQRIAGVPPALCRKANKKAVEISTSLISGLVQPLAGETPAILGCRRFACKPEGTPGEMFAILKYLRS
jgi:hypothetical protein